MRKIREPEMRPNLQSGLMRVGVKGACLILPVLRGDEQFASIELDASQLLGLDRGRRLDPLSQLGLVAIDGARQCAGQATHNTHPGPHQDSSRHGVAVGSALGATTTTVRYARRLVGSGAAATNPIDFPDSIDGAPAAHLALDLGLGGPSITFADGEQSAVTALVQAARQIAWGRATRMYVVVGDKVDASLGQAMAADPAFVGDASGGECMAAECVFALVLEGHTDPELELTGFLHDAADASMPACDGGVAAFLWQMDGRRRMRLLNAVRSGCQALRDPSGALVLAGAWLALAGPVKFFGGAVEPVAAGPIADRIRCGMPHHSQLSFVRRHRP